MLWEMSRGSKGMQEGWRTNIIGALDNGDLVAGMKMIQHSGISFES